MKAGFADKHQLWSRHYSGVKFVRSWQRAGAEITPLEISVVQICQSFHAWVFGSKLLFCYHNTAAVFVCHCPLTALISSPDVPWEKWTTGDVSRSDWHLYCFHISVRAARLTAWFPCTSLSPLPETQQLVLTHDKLSHAELLRVFSFEDHWSQPLCVKCAITPADGLIERSGEQDVHVKCGSRCLMLSPWNRQESDSPGASWEKKLQQLYWTASACDC